MPKPRDVDVLIPEGDSLADRLRRRRQKMEEGDPEGAAEEMRRPPPEPTPSSDDMGYMGGLHRNRRGYTKD
jgi:hypothetical protein